jgi:hypothetical protein
VTVNIFLETWGTSCAVIYSMQLLELKGFEFALLENDKISLALAASVIGRLKQALLFDFLVTYKLSLCMTRYKKVIIHYSSTTFHILFASLFIAYTFDIL